MGNSVIVKSRDIDLINKYQEDILESYTLDPNVSDIIKKFGASRNSIVRLLKSKGLYKGLDGYSPSRVAKVKSSIQAKFGDDIINYGQTKGMRDKLKERNNRPFNVVPWKEDLSLYKRKCDKLTIKNKKFVYKADYCFYTGIKMLESNLHNPNNPLLRTLDHKISVVEGFMLGIDPEVISSPTNLVYCIRYINTLKGNMSADDIIKLVPFIRKELINAGYEHN